MRKNILAGGVTLLAVAIIFGLSYPDGLLFSLPLAVLNIILGLVTKAPPGLEVQPRTGGIRLVIDRGVVRASIYQLVFTDFKLVLKRLSSANVTIILPLMLAVLGFLFLFIIGAWFGGITGFFFKSFLPRGCEKRFRMKRRRPPVGQATIKADTTIFQRIGSAKNRPFFL